MKKTIGFMGLGKMGQNMVMHLLSKNYQIVAYNRSQKPIKQLEKKGATPSYSIKELIEKLPKSKIIIMMLTAGQPVGNAIANLLPYLNKGDIIIDGGNSFYKDSIRRYNLLKKKEIYLIDLGISGGIEGARNGASLMIGGDKSSFKKIEYLFKDLAVKEGYAYLGPSGAGHFAKMIHNGIEYVMLETYGEGFELLEKSKYKYEYKDIAKVWNHGSVIRSYITELIERVFMKNPHLRGVQGIIGGGETGAWSYEFAKSVKGDVESLKHALEKRKLSKSKQTFSTKLISILRHEFGSHILEEIKKSK